MSERYKISAIAQLTGLSIPTLRYYEDLGILKPFRDSNNYRIYTERELSWIEFIQRAKATGMTLAKITEYSNLREKGNETIDQRIAILEEQEKILQAEKKVIEDHLQFLQNKKAAYYQLKSRMTTEK